MSSNLDLIKQKLNKLVLETSKHSDYQILHPLINDLIDGSYYMPGGKAELERASYMSKFTSFYNKTVIDIGANTGYFSYEALTGGAEYVEAYEGNENHAAFVRESSEIIGYSQKINVLNKYYDFHEFSCFEKKFDLGICLNVLHHVGDDFGDANLELIQAKEMISLGLKNLSFNCKALWFQLGFNWKGKRNFPLFSSGTKQELIDFVKFSCVDDWEVLNIGIFNPETKQYEDASPALLSRYDHLGEFLNRPIFLLKNRRQIF